MSVSELLIKSQLPVRQRPFHHYCVTWLKVRRPRDGKNITQSKLKAALIVSSNASPTLAEVQSGIVKSVAHLDGTFTLVDLRKHNAIEHDRSFTRLDFRQGDNTSFQPAMFRAFLADAEGGPITPASIARTRARRDAEGKQDVEAQPLGVRLWLTTWTQTCVLLEFFGQEVSVEDITMLYQEERLPEWWIENPGHPTLHSLLGTVLNVFWKHLWVKVPRGTLDNPQREW